MYCRATEDQQVVLQRVLEKHHDRLSMAGVTIDLLEARSELDEEDEPNAPALRQGGVRSSRDCSRGESPGSREGVCGCVY